MISISEEDFIEEESPEEEEVSDVLESYVNSLTPFEKAELQEEVNEELSEAEEGNNILQTILNFFSISKEFHILFCAFSLSDSTVSVS